jgi:hypothetical protein
MITSDVTIQDSKTKLLPLAFNKIKSLGGRYTVDRARLVVECDAVALVGDVDNLGTERRADELRLLRLGDVIQEAGHRRPVLSVQIGVDFVKDNKRAGLGGLEREDEAEGA